MSTVSHSGSALFDPALLASSVYCRFTCSSARPDSNPSRVALTKRLSPIRILVSPGATAIERSGKMSLTNQPSQSCFMLARQSSGIDVKSQPARASMPTLANTGPAISEAGSTFLSGAVFVFLTASFANRPMNGERSLRRFISR